MIQIENVTFSYGTGPENNEDTITAKTQNSQVAENTENILPVNGIHNLSLQIASGECVVLCGESGCGKTTVTRLINGLIPNYYEGKLSGKVLVNGTDVSSQPLYDTAQIVGSVFQNPRSQFFNVDTTSELSFGCENLGVPEERIRENLSETIRDFRMERLMDRSIFELSGGEKQKIACAGAAMIQPEVYVLDEPSSNLDVSSIMDLRRTLASWKKQGKTIIISEHRLYYLKDIADRFVYLKSGEIYQEYSKDEFAALTEEQRQEMGLRTFSLKTVHPATAQPLEKKHLELRNFNLAYKGGKQILHIDNCTIPANRIVGIIGNNGAGKSTFSRCLCGLEKKCGEMIWNGKKYRPKDRLSTCYMVMQEVNHQLFTESVLDEVMISMDNESPSEAEEMLEKLDLITYKSRHPTSLSGGQKQRVAIASAIASNRQIMIFDEPTSGLDYKHMKEVASILQQLNKAGISLYIITHDIELVAECCTDIIHFENGAIKDQHPLDEQGILKVRAYFSQLR